jgi:hypothetical protein
VHRGERPRARRWSSAPPVSASRAWRRSSSRRWPAKRALEVWTARGPPARAGAAFGMIGKGRPGRGRHRRGRAARGQAAEARARVARTLGATSEGARACAFIGQIAGVSFRATDDRRCARRRPTRRSWPTSSGGLSGVGSATAVRGAPVVLLLDDLHWATSPACSSSTGCCAASPTGRCSAGAGAPGGGRAVPRPVAVTRVREVRLGELSPRSAARLCRAVLGESTSQDVHRAHRGAGGRPRLFLEELIRSTARGRTDRRARCWPWSTRVG